MGLTVGVLVSGCEAEPLGRPVLEQPRSLASVEVDGELRVTESGDFAFDEDARALFDHFLAAEGEISDESVHGWVRQAIDDRLKGEPAEQAWEGYLNYVEYRHQMAALAQSYAGADPEAVVDIVVAQIAEIRAQTIGDVPGVPDEGVMLVVALEMRSTMEDPTMPSEAKAQRLGQLQAQQGTALDPDAPSRILMRLHAALDPIPMEDVEARRAVLIEKVGEAAAERWLALEHRRIQSLAAEG
ncbi:MAG: hypothetical protein K0V04_11360 [Deltaproteobacteria bacterium]|nr:hypothetical protein [Deltaproteobacteria bacterium]